MLHRIRFIVTLLAASAAVSCGVASAQTAPTGGAATDSAASQVSGGLTNSSLNQAIDATIERSGGIGESTSEGIGSTRNSSTTTTTGRTGGGGATGGFGGLGGGGLGSLFGNAFGFGGNAGGNNQPSIRTRVRSAVQVPPRPATQVRSSAVKTFSRLNRRGYGGVNVQVTGQTATLQGTVASEKDRRMSELLMRLEPGIYDVQNNLQVAP
ncbi:MULTISPECIES: BON domain-containing protein [Crateriforma]|uniref:BON domain protein n=1 Tax=Crateriforma conspicua TaxID=2527996 RepID=A0A5C6FXH5_9PLAN|nr:MULTISPECIES: BON domain-containing protein [Crateriforma]TWU66325.1 BON domain protein [Crateriforma conspicua]